jgi:hypothetical protein
VPEEQALPSEHTRRQRLLMQARPREQSSVAAQLLPVAALPSGPQSVNSVARAVSSKRQRPKSQPSDAVPQTGSQGREQSPYGVPTASNAQMPDVQWNELVQYSRQKSSAVQVCWVAHWVVLKQAAPARPVPAVTQAVDEPVQSHF